MPGVGGVGMVSRSVGALRSLSITLIAVVAALDGGAAASDAATVVQGNRRIGADAIRAYFHVRPGTQPDQFALDAALKQLYGTGAFEDVKIARSGEHGAVTEV